MVKLDGNNEKNEKVNPRFDRLELPHPKSAFEGKQTQAQSTALNARFTAKRVHTQAPDSAVTEEASAQRWICRSAVGATLSFPLTFPPFPNPFNTILTILYHLNRFEVIVQTILKHSWLHLMITKHIIRVKQFVRRERCEGLAETFCKENILFSLTSGLCRRKNYTVAITDTLRIKEKDTAWFVKFFVPCNNLGSLWDDLGKTMEGEDEIEVGEVDCGMEETFCSKVDIHSYPTFKVFYDGEEVARYQDFMDSALLIPLYSSTQFKSPTLGFYWIHLVNLEVYLFRWEIISPIPFTISTVAVHLCLLLLRPSLSGRIHAKGTPMLKSVFKSVRLSPYSDRPVCDLIGSRPSRGCPVS
ncbi:hypothetical protein V8G54_005763 [Vigna mungo]|uniref:Thioredoxin domain-containing protein n=1 Tax=Vigna mungo TaxID=3915 RepID=A0AAQ3P0B9_VIGMU